jgi:hypothetical protein
MVIEAGTQGVDGHVTTTRSKLNGVVGVKVEGNQLVKSAWVITVVPCINNNCVVVVVPSDSAR